MRQRAASRSVRYDRYDTLASVDWLEQGPFLVFAA